MPRNRRKGRRSSGGGGSSETDEIGKQGKFTEQDISDDEIDAFHDQRDVILFDNNKSGKGKQSNKVNDDPFDALATGSRSVLDIDEAESDESGNEEEDQSLLESVKNPRTKTFKKKQETSIPLTEDSSEDEDQDEIEEDDILTGGWGSNKRSYYNTNDLDDLESDSEMDEDEKRSMELREAKKIQSRARQGMTDDDFGLSGDHLANLESGQAAREQRKKDLDVSVMSNGQGNLQIPSIPLSPVELISKIQKDTPETMALIGEFADVVDDMNLVSNRMKILQETNPDHPSLSLIHLHHQTLLAYVTTLAFYFYIRSLPIENAQNSSSKLSKLIIIERLAKLKQGLSSLEDLGLGIDTDELEGLYSDEDEEDIENDENKAPTSFLFKPRGIMAGGGDGSSDDEGSVSLGSLEDDELMQLDAEEESSSAQKIARQSPVEVMKIESLTNSDDASGSKEGKRTRMRKRGNKTKNDSQSAPLAELANDLEANDDIPSPPTKRRKPSGGQNSQIYDEYTEPTSLSTVDESEKDAKRRSLKFHTGQIDAQKKSSRQLDGDLDIPYRDKERSRLAVASANANKAAKESSSSSNSNRRQLDDDEFGEQDARDWRAVMNMNDDSFGESSSRGGGGGGDLDADYYDLITNSRKASKEARKEDYDQQRASKRIAPINSSMEPGEHRSINREIEKNRGLTQRRPKSSRNPRVKKREKYAQAQKKLSSRGPVYKGGQSSLQGGYGGEKSGISTHVVKSRQFA